jgi:uncharacterized phage protein (TIGR01671 family)
MREILFRAKTKGKQKGTLTNKPIKANMWVYGSYDCGDLCGYELDMISDKKETYVIVPETRGQYIGLTAKDVKIFEGDIGRYNQTDGAKENGKPIICTGTVIYNEKTASYAVESKDEKGRKYFDYFPINDFEIIGNVHDNPELLEGGAE